MTRNRDLALMSIALPIEQRTPDRYIAAVTKRLLLALLLTWMAIAPAIANSCAAGCDTPAAPVQNVVHEHEEVANSASPDCHGNIDEREDSEMPEGNPMAMACFVASVASLPSTSISVVTVEAASEQHSVVLLPPLSFETSAPIKPPQA